MRDLCLNNSQTLINLVQVENEAQLEKWGIQDHEPFEWLGFATEELGEISKAISEWQFRGAPSSEVVKEAIQAATLCIKIAEMFIAQTEQEDNECKDLNGVPIDCNDCAAFAGGGCEGKDD